MDKIKTFIMNLSVKKKMIWLCFFLLFFSSMLLTSVVYLYTSKMIKDDTQRYSEEVMNQCGNYLNEKIKSILQNTYYLQLNPDFIQTMKNIKYSENRNYVDETGNINDIIAQLKSGEELIESISIYAEGQVFYNFDAGIAKNFHFLETELYHEMEDYTKIYWGSVCENELLNSKGLVIPMVFPVIVYNERFDDSYIILNLNASILREQLCEIGESLEGNVFIQNEEGEIIVFGDESLEEDWLKERLSESNGNKYQITLSGKMINGWQIGCLQSNWVLLKKVRILRNFMIVLAIICVAVFTVMASMVSNTITRPLKRLQVLMEQAVKNEFRQEFQVKYRDEIGQLAGCFNEMCVRIRWLMEQVELEAALKRKAELQALNDQINPHFIYNTLDCIYWACMRDGNKDIADVAFNISNVFRLGLNKGNEITTIKKELKHVESYMKIQKIIYKGKFDYQIYCQQDIKNVKIIKLILQPLVENSILHGFKNMECDGEIFIQVSDSGQHIVFQVIDNGCGMDKPEGGLAIKNIRKRLKLHYQDQASLEYEQGEFGGTAAIIKIPLER